MIKARNIVCGQEIEVRVIDAEYNEECVEVEILEGAGAGKYAVVNKADIVEPVELTSSLNKREFDKLMKWEEVEKIYVCVWNDAEGLYIEAYAKVEDDESSRQYETIAYSNNHFESEANEAKLLKEAKKLYTKLKKWGYDIEFLGLQCV